MIHEYIGQQGSLSSTVRPWQLILLWRTQWEVCGGLIRYPTHHLWALENSLEARKWIWNWKPPRASPRWFSIPNQLSGLKGFFQIPVVKSGVSTNINYLWMYIISLTTSINLTVDMGNYKWLKGFSWCFNDMVVCTDKSHLYFPILKKRKPAHQQICYLFSIITHKFLLYS